MTSIFIYVLTAASIAYSVIALYCVWDFFGKKKDHAHLLIYEPVSVIKPIKGIGKDFKENVGTFCDQDYPEYEVLLGVTNDADDRNAAKEISSIPAGNKIRKVKSTEQRGANRKVSNLIGLLQSAKYDLLAISDSDMRADSEYLRKITTEYAAEKNTGLVTCLYKISDPPSVGAALESLSIALDFIPSVLIARKLEGVTFGLGATLLVSQKTIEEIGGMASIADYLADDYQIGNRLWQRGYKIVLSNVVIENVVGPMSFAEYFSHQLRWSRTCRVSRPYGYAGYGITHLFVLSLFCLAVSGFSPLAVSLLIAAQFLRYCLAALLHRLVIPSRKWRRWLVLLPVKDVLSFVIWVWSFVGNKITWKGIPYRILRDGRIKEDRSFG